MLNCYLLFEKTLLFTCVKYIYFNIKLMLNYARKFYLSVSYFTGIREKSEMDQMTIFSVYC